MENSFREGLSSSRAAPTEVRRAVGGLARACDRNSKRQLGHEIPAEVIRVHLQTAGYQETRAVLSASHPSPNSWKGQMCKTPQPSLHLHEGQSQPWWLLTFSPHTLLQWGIRK